MKISVRYFASVREKLGAGESLVLDAALDEPLPCTVGELHSWLVKRSPVHADALDESKGLRTAFNQTLCSDDQALSDGAEIAFFPPVTGG